MNTVLPASPAASSEPTVPQTDTPGSLEGSTNTELPAASNQASANTEPGVASNLAFFPGSATVETGNVSNPAPSVTHASSPDASAANTKTVVIATVTGSSIISTTPGVSYVVVSSQRVTLGDAALTVGGQVVQLQSSAGLAIQNTTDGSISTYAVPSTVPSPVNARQSIALYEGQTISGIAIASSVAVISSQTVGVSSSVVTLSGSQVASLRASGLVVEAPRGKELQQSLCPKQLHSLPPRLTRKLSIKKSPRCSAQGL
jgi:hypothetical protein